LSGHFVRIGGKFPLHENLREKKKGREESSRYAKLGRERGGVTVLLLRKRGGEDKTRSGTAQPFVVRRGGKKVFGTSSWGRGKGEETNLDPSTNRTE